MKSITYFTLLIAMFAFGSCAHRKNARAARENSQISISDTSTVVSLKRGFCFGTCKVYEVKFLQSGDAYYEGKANVDNIGHFIGKVSPSQIKSIQDYAREMEFNKLNDVYDDKRVMDIAGHTTSIYLDGNFKSVYRRIGFPQSIKKVEDKIDEVVDTIEWKKVDK